MIATISQQQAATELVSNFLETIKNQGFSGDTDASFSTRLSLSTDNSVYQQVPQGVIFPKSAKDIQLAMQIASRDPFLSLTFGPRGGGTGTNGQSLTPGIVVDLSGVSHYYCGDYTAKEVIDEFLATRSPDLSIFENIPILGSHLLGNFFLISKYTVLFFVIFHGDVDNPSIYQEL